MGSARRKASPGILEGSVRIEGCSGLVFRLASLMLRVLVPYDPWPTRLAREAHCVQLEGLHVSVGWCAHTTPPVFRAGDPRGAHFILTEARGGRDSCYCIFAEKAKPRCKELMNSTKSHCF